MDKEIKTVYISGQITGLELEEANSKFEEAEVFLLQNGYRPINPMKHNPHVEGKTWEEYMLEDIALLMQCDGICLLDNWQQSRGARIERYIAREMGIVIVKRTE